MDDRQIDILIHQYVMGECPHDLHAYKRDNRDPFDDYITWRCRKCKQTFRGLSYRGGKYPFPNYSTDMAATWTVVEKMQSAHDELLSLVYGRFLDDDGFGWEANWRRSDTGWATAKTAPMAICLASLEAVGVEVSA